MKSRVVASLTFHRDAIVDWAPAWLNAAASVINAAPGTCSPSAVSQAERTASAFGAMLRPAISTTLKSGMACFRAAVGRQTTFDHRGAYETGVTDQPWLQ